MHRKTFVYFFAKVIYNLVFAVAASSLLLGQINVSDESGVHATWLRLYEFSAAEFDLRAVEEGAFKTGPSLSLEEWLKLGQAINSLESSLQVYVQSNRLEITNRSTFQLNRKCILFDRAIFALGWLESSADTSLLLVALSKDKVAGTPFFKQALIQSLGMVGDFESVECLLDIIRSKHEPMRTKENSVYALTGGYLMLRHSKLPLDSNVLQQKQKALENGLMKFLKDEPLSKSFDVEAIADRFNKTGINAKSFLLDKANKK